MAQLVASVSVDSLYPSVYIYIEVNNGQLTPLMYFLFIILIF